MAVGLTFVLDELDMDEDDTSWKLDDEGLSELDDATSRLEDDSTSAELEDTVSEDETDMSTLKVM